jgi:hypothetical protein
LHLIFFGTSILGEKKEREREREASLVLISKNTYLKMIRNPIFLIWKKIMIIQRNQSNLGSLQCCCVYDHYNNTEFLNVVMMILSYQSPSRVLDAAAADDLLL